MTYCLYQNNNGLDFIHSNVVPKASYSTDCYHRSVWEKQVSDSSDIPSLFAVCANAWRTSHPRSKRAINTFVHSCGKNLSYTFSSSPNACGAGQVIEAMTRSHEFLNTRCGCREGARISVLQNLIDKAICG